MLYFLPCKYILQRIFSLHTSVQHVCGIFIIMQYFLALRRLFITFQPPLSSKSSSLTTLRIFSTSWCPSCQDLSNFLLCNKYHPGWSNVSHLLHSSLITPSDSNSVFPFHFFYYCFICLQYHNYFLISNIFFILGIIQLLLIQ